MINLPVSKNMISESWWMNFISSIKDERGVASIHGIERETSKWGAFINWNVSPWHLCFKDDKAATIFLLKFS